MHTLEPILAEHPFLKGLKQEHLALLVGCASNVRFEAGAFVFRQGQEANHFYILRDGKVAVELFAPQKGAVAIDTYGEGDVLGWSWLIPPYHWRFDARAIEPTRAISLDARCMRTKCEDDHELGYELMKRFARIIEQRLDATRWQLLDVYGVRS
ncbi:MAG: cyclic nucleotide-binding domain-containing protein [Acidobacteria bacterium]|nr:cyclic nucleotide-binding domain-containing protein [Acidobacteriota bacterium]